MDPLLLSSVGLGFVLGMRHALDPDHLAAVSTIVTEQRSLRRSSLVGSFWGAGHALALLLAGGLILAWKLSVPARVAAALEAGVAVMLVLLGLLAMRRSLRGLRLHAHRHSHDGSEHVHVHVHKQGERHVDHHHAHPLRFGVRPFAVGVMHGLAGSAGLALVVIGAAPSALAGLAYLLALALGSTAGMFVLSALMSLPLQLLASRYQLLHLRFQMLAGACSLALGLVLFGRHALGLS